MAAMSNTPSQPLQTPKPAEMNSDYEKCREERIKQNLERMQKLGIYDLSLTLKSIKPNRYRKKNNDQPNRCVSPLPSPVPSRRSSRLQNTPVVSYTEVDSTKNGKETKDILMMENSRPEVYTEEHEKLLGDTKTEWTLFVDGYGKDGKKIYDQVRGKTCHQCRQKTLGHRTHCIRCNLVQGQFCGDCLYMRYGENVLEAMQNPDWICPVCRGICNCSLCRQAKGWAPTGVLYRKISSLGYKSVAHYLIQTRRNSEEKTETPVCTKIEPLELQDLKHNNPDADVEFEDGLIATKPTKPESSDEFLRIATNEDEKPTELESSDEFHHVATNEDEKPTELESSLGTSAVKLENFEEFKDKNPESKVDENKNEVNESEVHLEMIINERKDNNIDDSTIVTPAETKKTGWSKRKHQVLALDNNSIAGRLRSSRRRT